MPQVFQVLKCYKCFAFQIHQTKKANKFDCKICGEKQSIKRHYGIGTGKDCRVHVQKLNMLRANSEIRPNTESNSDDENESKIDGNTPENIENSLPNCVKRSKWSEFIDNKPETEAKEESVFLGDEEVFLEIPQKKKTCKFNLNTKSNNSEEYLYSTHNTSKADFKCNLTMSNKNKIKNFKSEKISVQDDIPNINDTSTTCEKKLTCYNIGNQVKEDPTEKLVVLQAVNKNSKWAQYVDTGDNNLHSDLLSSNDPKIYITNSDNLFSQCDDSDLDQVLDI